MGDGTEYDDVLLRLPGFRVVAVTEYDDVLLVGIETIRRAVGCPSCGVIARTPLKYKPFRTGGRQAEPEASEFV